VKVYADSRWPSSPLDLSEVFPETRTPRPRPRIEVGERPSRSRCDVSRAPSPSTCLRSRSFSSIIPRVSHPSCPSPPDELARRVEVGHAQDVPIANLGAVSFESPGDCHRTGSDGSTPMAPRRWGAWTSTGESASEQSSRPRGSSSIGSVGLLMVSWVHERASLDLWQRSRAVSQPPGRCT